MPAASLIDLLWPLGVAAFVWWASTGLVLLLDGLPRRTFRLSLGGLSLLGIAALVCLSRTAEHATVTGAYAAFLCALLVWAWIELTFLTGFITGPSRQPVQPGAKGWARLRQAVAAIAWHELTIAALAVPVLALTWNAPNPVAGWTFLVLWVMRTSAKLNLFLGVRNTHADWLPPQLGHLASYFRIRRLNALLPFSVIGGAAGVAWLVSQALQPDIAQARSVGLLLTAALLALAVLEHLLLVLPITGDGLWRWAMRPHAEPEPSTDRPPASTAGAPTDPVAAAPLPGLGLADEART